MASVALVVSPLREVRDALKACIQHLDAGYQVVGVRSAAEVPVLKAGALPDLVVLDLDAPEAQDAAVVRTLAERFPQAVLTVTAESVDPRRIDDVLSAGACAYIPKAYAAQQKQLVLELALSGVGHRPHLPRSIPFYVPPATPGRAESGASHGERLTSKQVEVLSYAATGLSNKQIAAHLSITEGTVKVHMTSIFKKLKVDRRAKAIVLARRMEEVRRQEVVHSQRGDLVLDCLLPHVDHRRLRQGDVLFRKGDPGRELFYLQRGRLRLDDLGVEMGPGQIVGEVGVFAPDGTRTSTARCLTDVELFCLSSEQVKSIYYLNPQFALHIVTLVAQRLVEERMH